MKYTKILEARMQYRMGGNITQYLREKSGNQVNTAEIIEIAYDLQSGSYIEFFKCNRQRVEEYAKELGGLLSTHLEDGDSILDVGTGEMTTISLVLNNLDIDLSHVFAFDISWSRLSLGKKFLKENSSNKGIIQPFVADITEIPMNSSCVDVVTSSHALEPNGKNIDVLLAELFRITKKKLVLFEPSYELNSEDGRDRMDTLGYIKDIEGVVVRLGGRVLDVIPICNVINPLNPTACYVIEPPNLNLKYDSSPMYPYVSTCPHTL